MRRLLLIAPAVAALAVWWAWQNAPGPATVPDVVDAMSPVPAPAVASPVVRGEVPRPAERDPFRYAETALKPPVPPPRVQPAPPPVTVAARPSAVRLVGFVRRSGRLKAALAISGDVVVVGAGEDASGYAVLAIDEETGVVLRAPGGDEMTLTPPL